MQAQGAACWTQRGCCRAVNCPVLSILQREGRGLPPGDRRPASFGGLRAGVLMHMRPDATAGNEEETLGENPRRIADLVTKPQPSRVQFRPASRIKAAPPTDNGIAVGSHAGGEPEAKIGKEAARRRVSPRCARWWALADRLLEIEVRALSMRLQEAPVLP